MLRRGLSHRRARRAETCPPDHAAHPPPGRTAGIARPQVGEIRPGQAAPQRQGSAIGGRIWRRTHILDCEAAPLSICCVVKSIPKDARAGEQAVQSVSVKTGSDPGATTVAPFQVRGHSFTAVVLRITGVVDAAFHAAVDALMRHSPQFYLNAPIVLDVSDAQGLETKADFARLARELRLRKLFVMGVQNATEAQSTSAFQAGLVTLHGGREAELARPGRARAAEAEAEPAAPEAGGNLLVTEPVRSGQRIFAEHGDLVVVSSVSSGAELVARGNIHVYGALRGRALAGVHGDTSARIFCQSLEADLIAIAGLYRTSEDLDRRLTKQRVQAFLDDDTLRVEPLK